MKMAISMTQNCWKWEKIKSKIIKYKSESHTSNHMSTWNGVNVLCKENCKPKNNQEALRKKKWFNFNEYQRWI